jgi:hypothetical protein
MFSRFAVRLWCGTCVIFAISVRARAQRSEPVVTDKLDITVTSAECDDFPDLLSVVMDDEDGIHRFTIPRRAGCEWSGSAPETFDAGLTHFSLRLDKGKSERRPLARTDCRTPDTHQIPGIARLKFECCRYIDVRQLTVTTTTRNTNRPVAISYLRGVPKVDQSYSVPCIEHGVFLDGAGTIDHVQFQNETLRLQLGNSEPKPKSTGLLVRIPEAKFGKKINFDVSLDSENVVKALAEQRARGDGGAPNESPNAIDVDYKKLKDAGVKTLKLTVQ